MDTLSDEDEAVASDLDLHALIASSQNPLDFDAEPFQSAEEVIKEIDDLMQVMFNHQQIKSITERPTGCLFDLQVSLLDLLYKRERHPRLRREILLLKMM